MDHWPDFLRNIYANLVSNVITWLVCGIGSFVLALFVLLTQGLNWWQETGIVFLFGMVLMGLAIATYRAEKYKRQLIQGTPAPQAIVNTTQLATDLLAEIKRRQTTTQEAIQAAQEKSESTVVLPPKDPDLRGQILEVLFKPNQNLTFLSAVYILVRVSVTNHGAKPAVVMQWKLDIGIGSEIAASLPSIAIPKGWTILNNADPVHHAILDLALLAQEPCIQAIPKIGWLLFEFQPWGGNGTVEPPYNARFSILATDSLGGEHTFSKEPEIYFKRSVIMPEASA